MLEQAAGRAVIAVSISFDKIARQPPSEPIALRLELIHAPDDGGWTITNIGYL